MKTLLTNSAKSSKFLPPPFLPYDYQQPIIKKMVETVLAGKNGLVIQPTATGKSVEAAFTARACALLYKKKGLYLYDENEGLNQARIKFEEIFNRNPITCANFFGYGKDENVFEADMVFASFQSLNNHHKKSYLRFDQNHFDYIIVNEAHHGQAITYKEVLDYFLCSKIGMSATPDRMDGKDILEIFEEVIAKMLLEEAIVKGLVSQIEYHILSHNLSTKKLEYICKEVLEEGKRISIKQLNETIFIEMLDEEMLREVYSYACASDKKPLQTLFFCENIAHAEHVLSLLKRDGKSADVVHSKRGKSHNRKVMKEYRKNNIQFLLSVDKLNEDIDVPNVQLGVFLRATDSMTVFFQQLGRLLRKTATKHKAIILDFVGNCERLLIVQGLVDKIRELAEIENIPLQKDPLHVSGVGFDFNFSQQTVNILKMLERIREGFYPTWQEASQAAIALGIKTSTEYSKLKRYKEDPRLPGYPNEVYKDFPGWAQFLGGIEKDFYPTWQEASQAAIALGIKTSIEYAKLKRYKEDPRLPGYPKVMYKDFPGWAQFLGGIEKDFYPTWQEASQAAIALGIKNKRKFCVFKRYKEDLRLSSTPHITYPDFPGWEIFLQTGRNFYPTWQEASQAAIALGIKTSTEYTHLGKYKEDPRLSSQPNKTYPDFPGWEIFLQTGRNFYPTWQEASQAAIALGIKTSTEYLKSKRYKEDSQLPAFPNLVYKDFPGWTQFLGGIKKEPYPTWQEASQAAIALGIETSTEYGRLKRYKEDPRLVARVHVYYKDFPGWTQFLGGIEKDFYPTWQEASQAAIALGIETYTEYIRLKKYKEDPRLSSQPNKTYPDFPGWSKFLEKTT